MWKSRPEVMRETGVLFKGQQPKDETTKVKEFLEEGDDPGPKMRPLDSPYPPNASYPKVESHLINRVPTPVLILLSP